MFTTEEMSFFSHNHDHNKEQFLTILKTSSFNHPCYNKQDPNLSNKPMCWLKIISKSISKWFNDFVCKMEVIQLCISWCYGEELLKQ